MDKARHILADFDEEGIWVYQAFKPTIVRAALKGGTFGAGFSLERMTWIKPSLGWMLYRSGYAGKPDQEAIAKIKIGHAAFRELLGQAVLSTFSPALFASEPAWQESLRASEVRVQWDPDRNLRLERLDRRAIQIGLRGEAVRRYVSDWIIAIREVTDLAHALRKALDERTELPAVPVERPYPVDDETARRLGMVSDG